MASRIGKVLLICLYDLAVYWRTLVIVLAPVIYLPLILCLPDSSEARCGYALLIMATYWVTEALPLAVTAFLPFVLFPLLGIMSGKAVASTYIADTSMVLLGGLVVALAVEKCGLHTRIALRILLMFGPNPSGVLFGFMLPSWFFSMWISNTATTGMMIPVAEEVLEQMEQRLLRKNPETAAAYAQRVNPSFEIEETYFGNTSASENEEKPFTFSNETHPWNRSESESQTDALSSQSSSDMASADAVDGVDAAIVDVDSLPADPETVEQRKELKRFGKILALSIAYASNIGGTATLVGTPTNLIVAEVANQLYDDYGLASPVTYVSWMAFGIPHSIMCVILAYAWLIVVYVGPTIIRCRRRPKHENQADLDKDLKALLRKEYEKLGPIRFAEIEVGIMFVVLVILWFARDPGFAPGYASLFEKGYVSDSFPAILVSVLLFILPSEIPNWMCCRGCTGRAKSVPALLNWEYAQAKLPWGPMLVLGSGYALAKAFDDTGLSVFLGGILESFTSLNPWLVVLITALIVSLLTEITSNTAIINVVIPIIIGMTQAVDMNPLYLMLPAGMAASYAFMLPIATPSNTIVFSYGRLRVVDMASVGIVMNLLCLLVVTVGINTWGWAIFNLSENPFSTAVNSTVAIGSITTQSAQL